MLVSLDAQVQTRRVTTVLPLPLPFLLITLKILISEIKEGTAPNLTITQAQFVSFLGEAILRSFLGKSVIVKCIVLFTAVLVQFLNLADFNYSRRD